MNQELDARKGFLLVTAFVLVLLVGFNFDRFSGEAVRKGTPDTTVTVKPDVVRASESVTVYIDTDARYGSRNRIHVYDMSRDRPRRVMSRQLYENCGGSACKKSTSTTFRTLATWSGKYCVSTRDVATGKDVLGCFVVEPR